MKTMETIENIYASMFNEHENIQASNPWGCNQYGEGWKAPHNGKQSKAGEPAKKDSGDNGKNKKKYDYGKPAEFIKDARKAAREGKLDEFIEKTDWGIIEDIGIGQFYYVDKDKKGLGLFIDKDNYEEPSIWDGPVKYTVIEPEHVKKNRDKHWRWFDGYST